MLFLSYPYRAIHPVQLTIMLLGSASSFRSWGSQVFPMTPKLEDSSKDPPNQIPPPDPRQNITLPILSSLIPSLPFTTRSASECAPFQAAMSAAFYGLFRVGEITVTGSVPEHTILYGCLVTRRVGAGTTTSQSITLSSSRDVTSFLRRSGVTGLKSYPARWIY